MALVANDRRGVPMDWPAFVARVHKRAPAAWRGLDVPAIASAEQVFAGLLEATRRNLASDHRIAMRLFADTHPVSPLEPALLPRASDRSCAGYIARMQRLFGDAGLLVNNFQAVDGGLWNRVQRFLSGLYDAVGVPSGGALLDVFLTGYRRGFFGVHKDDQDVFTFVLEGRKRFLVWPFETFADRVSSQAARARSVMLGPTEVDAFRSRATVIEGGVGDVLYWPREWWHVAEGDRAPALSFSLGLFRGGDPTRFALQHASALIAEGGLALSETFARRSEHGGEAEKALREAHTVMRRTEGHPALRARVDESLLAFWTAFGFDVVPTPRGAEAKPPRGLLALSAPGAIAWRALGDELTWAVNGSVFRNAKLPSVVGLFEGLRRGDQVRMDRRSSWAANATEAPVIRGVLETLWRHHALEPVLRPRARAQRVSRRG